MKVYENNKQCWLKNVKNIFDKAGLSELFSYNGCNRDIANFIMLRYRDQTIQAWHQDLTRENSRRGCGGNKLRTYKLFKSKFEQEPYLAVVKVVQHRVALTRLRVSSHSLAIEVGRYHRPKQTPPHLRLCTTCHCIEDEVHFLCVCPRYSELRKELETAVCSHYPAFKWLDSVEQFIYLLQNTNAHILCLLSAFVYKAFKLHSCMTDK